MKTWTEDQFQHLLWYVTSEPRPIGTLEQDFGPAFSPQALCDGRAGRSKAVQPQFAPSERLTLASSSDEPFKPVGIAAPAAMQARVAAAVPPATPARDVAEGGCPSQCRVRVASERVPDEEPVELGVLISWIEEEVEEKELCQRALAVGATAGDTVAGPGRCGLLYGHGLEGQAAVDAYVSEIVTIIRDFPYERLRGDREAIAWVRDEVVAPSFRDRWDFYSNRKRGAGLDLQTLEHILCGKNMLLDRLRYARRVVAL